MKYKILLFFIIVVHILACKNQDQLYTEQLLGTWDVYASQMNGKPNGFMKDGYFIFHKNNTVESNLFENNLPQPYSVTESKLKIENSIPFELNIGSLQNDSLYLEGRMSLYYMEYFLTKRK